MAEHPISRERREQLLETAADWVVRLQEGELPPETIDSWQRWLDTSADHRRAFEDVQALWGKIGALSYLPEAPTASELRADRYTGAQRVRQWRRQTSAKPAWPRWGLAAAASVLVTIGLAAAVWQLLGTVADPEHRYRTVTGQHQQVVLPDGSSIELGAATSVTVSYSDDERGIELLDGVAFFDVVKDPHRPFVVHAGGGSVTAVGTAFSVQRRNAEVTVVVSDGLVEVAKPLPAGVPPTADAARQPELVQLPAGQRVAFSSGKGLELPVVADVAAAIAWREGRLVFHDETLGKAVDDVNRYSRIPIELQGEAIAELRLTGYVVTSQIDGWLSGLESVLPVRVTRYDDRIVLSSRMVSPTQE